MSDITPLDGYRINPATLIDDRIANHFMADYGIVESVNSDKTINVTLAIQDQLLNSDQPLPPTIIHDIELMYIGSKAYYESFPIVSGDTVLLIGLRHYVPTISGISSASAAKLFMHYQPNTMKAIPLGIITGSKVTATVDSSGNYILSNTNSSGNIRFQASGGKLQLKNTAKSLYTLLNTFESAVNTFTGAAAQSSITSGGSSSTALAAAIVALMTTYQATMATALTDLAALLEE